jgi:hypothetical protein
MIPLIGYAPDLNPTTPGVIVDCVGYIPSVKGMKAAPSAVTGSLSAALAAACIGASVLRKLDGTTRLFAGTTTALYEGGAAAWTDRTRASGGAYTAGVDTRWRFAQFGNVSLATDKTDVMQFSTTGAFANIASGISAAIVETAGDYIVACNTSEASFGDSPNRWWVTPDYTNWTPSISNLIATGILTSSPGAITAARRFGDGVVLYKERSMYLGAFVGPPAIFSVQEVPGNIGAPSQEAVVFIGTQSDPRHIFMGYEDFYLFDGARPQPIGGPVRETVFNDLNRSFAYKCSALHDRFNARVYFFYPSNSGSGTIDKCVVYNYRTDKWGRDDRTIEASVDFVGAGYTYDDYGSLFSTYDTTANISYDSPFWLANTTVPAIFNTSHVVQTLSGAAGTCSFTPGDVGDEVNTSLLRRVQPRFLITPTTAQATNYYREKLGDSLTADSTNSISHGRFDFLREAHWHRVTIQTTGNCEVSDMRMDLEIGGEE